MPGAADEAPAVGARSAGRSPGGLGCGSPGKAPAVWGAGRRGKGRRLGRDCSDSGGQIDTVSTGKWRICFRRKFSNQSPQSGFQPASG